MINRNIALIQPDCIFKEKNPMIVRVTVLEGDFKTGQSVEYEGEIGILQQIQNEGKVIEDVSSPETAAFMIEGVEYKRDILYIYGKETDTMK